MPNVTALRQARSQPQSAAGRTERLARKIADDTTDAAILECARDPAQAELDLAQVRKVKVAPIERMFAFGESQALGLLNRRAKLFVG